MLKKFIKYQSLGNHFIIFDWRTYTESSISTTIAESTWPEMVIQLCTPAFGIGADGILLITTAPEPNSFVMRIFNADGSQAENCLNGLRCVAHFLLTQNPQTPSIRVFIGNRVSICSQDATTKDIITSVGKATFEKTITLNCAGRSFTGHSTNIGNPHFLIEEQITHKDLLVYGPLLESHPEFPNKTNVEFFWLKNNTAPHFYINMLPFERGAGPTLACSSGVAVLLDFLLSTKRIQHNTPTTCSMPGGSTIGWVNEQGVIFLQAAAHHIFNGILP